MSPYTEATALFCTFRLPLCLHLGYFFGVAVTNCQAFVQLSAFLNRIFFHSSNSWLWIPATFWFLNVHFSNTFSTTFRFSSICSTIFSTIFENCILVPSSTTINHTIIFAQYTLHSSFTLKNKINTSHHRSF